MEKVICPKCGEECYAYELEEIDVCIDCCNDMEAAEIAYHTKAILSDEDETYSPAQIDSW